MAQQIEKRNEAVGLMTSANPLALPPGGLLEAHNVVVQEAGVIEPRRGFTNYVGSDKSTGTTRAFDFVAGLSGYRPVNIFETTEGITWALSNPGTGRYACLTERPTRGLTNANGGGALPNRDWGDSLRNTWATTAYNTEGLVKYARRSGYAPPASTRYRSTVLTTSQRGILRSGVSAIAVTAPSYSAVHQGVWLNSRLAGLPAPVYLNATATKSSTAFNAFNASGVLTASNTTISSVAFRAVFRREGEVRYNPGVPLPVEADPILVMGAPSERLVVASPLLPAVGGGMIPSDGLLVMTLSFTGPHGMVPGDKFRVVSASHSAAVGYHTVLAVQGAVNTSQSLTVQLTGGNPSDHFTVSEWQRPLNVTLRVSTAEQPSESEVRLYRSEVLTVPSSIGVSDPGDEMFELRDATGVAVPADKETEFSLTISNFDAGTLLYTNPSRETIAQANGAPPVSRVLTQFADHTIYANVDQVGTSVLQCLDPTALVGAQKGITITGLAAPVYPSLGIATTETYTAGVAEVFTPPYVWKVYTDGTPSQNLENSLRSLIRVVGRTSVLVQISYLSDFNDTPGRLVITNRPGVVETTVDAISLSATPRDQIRNNFEPPLPANLKTETFGNRLFYSKYQQPEHVPALNYIDLGDSTSEILALAPTEDRLTVITSRGIYEMSGYNAASFAVRPTDLTLSTTAPRTTITVGTDTFTLTNAGFTKVTQGAQSISTPIDDLIQPRLRWKNTFDLAHAVYNPIRREIVLFLPRSEASTHETIGYRYSLLTQAWTVLDRSATASYFDPDTADLVLGLTTAQNQKLVTERATGTLADYQEETTTGGVTVVAGQTLLTMDDPFYPVPLVGSRVDHLGQKTFITSVKAATGGAYAITSEPEIEWQDGYAVTIDQAIPTRVVGAPFHAGNSGLLKQFTEACIVLKDNSVSVVQLGFRTDQSRAEETINIRNESQNQGWGQAPWGQFAWGETTQKTDLALKTYVPAACQYARTLTVSFEHNRAGEKFQLIEWSIGENPVTERTIR